MKSFIVLTILTLAALSYASTKDWKVVAETKDCSEDIKILAKEGEAFVYALKGSTKTKLLSGDGSAYERDNKKSVSFISQTSESGETISYLQPSMIEANPAKIQIVNSNKNVASSYCRLANVK